MKLKLEQETCNLENKYRFSIADKVKIMVIPMVLIPFIFIIFGALFLGRIYLRNIFGAGTGGSLQPYANPVLTMNGTAELVLAELQKELDEDPDHFLNTEYLDEINDQLQDNEVGFLIKIEDEIYYRGGEKNDTLEALLPEYGDNDQIKGGLFVDAEKPFYLRQQDFVLSDGRTGSVFVITYTDTLLRNMRRVLIELLLMVAGVLMLVSGFISIYIFNSWLRLFFNKLHISIKFIRFL